MGSEVGVGPEVGWGWGEAGGVGAGNANLRIT